MNMSMHIRVERETIVRESDGHTVIVAVGYLGSSDRPMFIHVLDVTALDA